MAFSEYIGSLRTGNLQVKM